MSEAGCRERRQSECRRAAEMGECATGSAAVRAAVQLPFAPVSAAAAVTRVTASESDTLRSAKCVFRPSRKKSPAQLAHPDAEMIIQSKINIFCAIIDRLPLFLHSPSDLAGGLRPGLVESVTRALRRFSCPRGRPTNRRSQSFAPTPHDCSELEGRGTGGVSWMRVASSDLRVTRPTTVPAVASAAR